MRFNQRWSREGCPELRIGIAVHCGDVLVGNIASPQRMEFTVIGDAVNVSWKLQELSKEVPAQLIVSESVASLVVEHFELRSLGKSAIRGVPEPIEVFAVSRAIALAHEEAVGTVTSKRN